MQPERLALELAARWAEIEVMPYCYQISGHTLLEGLGFRPAEHTDYEIVVAFERWEDNRETLENFVTRHWGLDLKANPNEAFHFFTPENCARAVAEFHFHAHGLRFREEGVTYRDRAPGGKPAEGTQTFRLWITKQVKKDAFTALNAGWELYARCEHTKLSVPEAKDLIRSKFPGDHFAWHEVVRAFHKQGGRSTAKYLRRDS